MKSLVVYSSKTGNTKMVAEAIYEVMPNPTLTAIEEASNFESNIDEFDIIAIGYWVDKGLPDAKVLDYFKTLKNKKIIVFGTLGAYPDSDHAKDCIKKAESLAINEEELGENKNTVLGSFICMGKVDPKLLEMMAKKMSAHHPMTEERKQRIEEGKKHPDENDLNNAKQFAKDCLAKI